MLTSLTALFLGFGTKNFHTKKIFLEKIFTANMIFFEKTPLTKLQKNKLKDDKNNTKLQ